MMADELTTQESIDLVLTNFAEFLKEKNRLYGDAVIRPLNIFSKLPAGEQILVRLDDKVSRVMNTDNPRKNDISDILGYCVLYMVLHDWTEFSDLID